MTDTFLIMLPAGYLELDRGEGIPFEGNYSQWLENKEQRLESEEKAESARQKAIKQELGMGANCPKGTSCKK